MTQGVKAPAAMILIWCIQNIPLATPEGLGAVYTKIIPSRAINFEHSGNNPQSTNYHECSTNSCLFLPSRMSLSIHLSIHVPPMNPSVLTNFSGNHHRTRKLSLCGPCGFDNFWCPQFRQSWHHGMVSNIHSSLLFNLIRWLVVIL